MEFDNAGGEGSWTAVKDSARDGLTLFKLAGGMLATGLALSAEELADILWLAERLPLPTAGGEQPAPVPIGDDPGGKADADKQRIARDDAAADDAQTLRKDEGAAKGGPAAGIFTPQMTGTISASTLRVPGVAATDHPEDMRRALQPFARRVPSRWHRVLDEDETASFAAETGVWSPVYRPVRERWFELSVVVEASASMELWDEALEEFLRLLRNQGGFRSVVAYRLDDPEGRTVSTADGRRRHPVSHLLCGQRPHLMLLASDATSTPWHNGAAHAFLRHVGRAASVSVLQPLPRRSWRHTALGEPELSFFAERAGDANARMKALLPWWLDESDLQGSVRVPVVGMDARSIGDWARTMTARGGAAVPGVLLGVPPAREPGAARPPQPPPPTPAERVARYRGMVSRAAYELAVFLSVPDPLTIPVMRLVQRTMLPGSGTAELAEFFVGGLLQGVDMAASGPAGEATVDAKKAPAGEPCYRLVDGVRDELTRSLRYSEEGAINSQLRSVGRYLLDEGREDSSFDAVFPSPTGRHRITQWSLPFASVSKEVLTGAAPAQEVQAAEAANEPAEPAVEPNSSIGPATLRITLERDRGGIRYSFRTPGNLVHYSTTAISARLMTQLVRGEGVTPSSIDSIAQMISTPELRRDLSRAESVILVPDDELRRVPWERLLWTDWPDEPAIALTIPVLRDVIERTPAVTTRPPTPRPLIWVVSDPDSTQPQLPGAQQEATEVAVLLQQLKEECEIEIDIRGAMGDLVRALEARPFRALFVSGHGVRSVSKDGTSVCGVQYGGGGQLLQAEHILAHDPPPELVFLACNYLAEMAPQLLQGGVSTVVAAHDVVDEHSAFAVRFFEAMVAGATFAEAVLKARQAAFNERTQVSDESWAQYQCFGAAQYRLVSSEHQSSQPPAADAQAKAAPENSPPPAEATNALPAKRRVYVAHASADRAEAERFVQALGAGLSANPQIGIGPSDIFLLGESLQAGSEWERAVKQAIDDSVVMVFLMSGASLASIAVMEQEVRTAVSQGVPLVPVLLSPCRWQDTPLPSRRGTSMLGNLRAIPLGPSGDLLPVMNWSDPRAAWRVVVEEIVGSLPGLIERAAALTPDEGPTNPPAGVRAELDRETQALLAACSPVPNRRMPSGVQTAVWFGNDMALTIASRNAGDRFHWDEADSTDLPFGVSDLWGHLLGLAEDVGGMERLFSHTSMVRIANREFALSHQPQLLLLSDNEGSHSRRVMPLAGDDEVSGVVEAQVLYFVGEQGMQCEVNAQADRVEDTLRITPRDNTQPWPLPPEAHGAPVVSDGRCIGMLVYTSIGDGHARAKDASTLRAALRAAWRMRLHAGLEAHHSWVESKGGTGQRLSLAGADLSGCVLPEGDLREAELPAVRWTGSVLDGARFDRAHMPRSRLEQASLHKATFAEADLSSSSFSGATLDGSDFLKAQLRGADFAGASIAGCHWASANVQGAKFDRSHATDASLRRAVGLSHEEFLRSMTDGEADDAVTPITVIAARDFSRPMYESVRQARVRFVAAGDSWFGADAGTSLLHALAFAGPTLALDCSLPWSQPGVDAPRPSNMDLFELLGPAWSATAVAFDAVLLSAGGDDLIEAASVRPALSNGEPTPREQRLLLRRDEWKEDAGGGYRYISEQGVSTLEVFLQAHFDHIVRIRDEGPMRGKPIFIHGYADPMPRPARTRDGRGPWLQPALADYGIPIEDHLITAQTLMFCLRGLLHGIASDTRRFPNVHFFDSSRVRLERAGANQAGEDGDWASEVHPNASGYAKLARAWSEHIESVLRPKQSAA